MYFMRFFMFWFVLLFSLSLSEAFEGMLRYLEEGGNRVQNEDQEIFFEIRRINHSDYDLPKVSENSEQALITNVTEDGKTVQVHHIELSKEDGKALSEKKSFNLNLEEYENKKTYPELANLASNHKDVFHVKHSKLTSGPEAQTPTYVDETYNYLYVKHHKEHENAQNHTHSYTQHLNSTFINTPNHTDHPHHLHEKNTTNSDTHNATNPHHTAGPHHPEHINNSSHIHSIASHLNSTLVRESNHTDHQHHNHERNDENIDTHLAKYPHHTPGPHHPEHNATNHVHDNAAHLNWTIISQPEHDGNHSHHSHEMNDTNKDSHNETNPHHTAGPHHPEHNLTNHVHLNSAHVNPGLGPNHDFNHTHHTDERNKTNTDSHTAANPHHTAGPHHPDHNSTNHNHSNAAHIDQSIISNPTHSANHPHHSHETNNTNTDLHNSSNPHHTAGPHHPEHNSTNHNHSFAAHLNQSIIADPTHNASHPHQSHELNNTNMDLHNASLPHHTAGPHHPEHNATNHNHSFAAHLNQSFISNPTHNASHPHHSHESNNTNLDSHNATNPHHTAGPHHLGHENITNHNHSFAAHLNISIISNPNHDPNHPHHSHEKNDTNSDSHSSQNKTNPHHTNGPHHIQEDKIKIEENTTLAEKREKSTVLNPTINQIVENEGDASSQASNAYYITLAFLLMFLGLFCYNIIKCYKTARSGSRVGGVAARRDIERGGNTLSELHDEDDDNSLDFSSH